MKIISHFLILTILSFGKIGYWENNKKILQENNLARHENGKSIMSIKA